MDKCVNTSHLEFKKLVEQSKMNPLVLKSKIGVWQEKNNSDDFPTIEELETENITPNIKEGVPELFESKPELVNQVYEESEITPEQEQQVQQLYSKYLDTIFPDSKIKDIVYHGANEPIISDKFIVTEDATGGGIWFTGSKKYAQIQMDRAQPSESLIGRPLRGKPTMYRVLLNIKNPKNFYNSSGAMLVQTPSKFEEQYNRKVNDAALFHHPNSKKPPYKDSADQVVIFNPEQVHILGSKEDIEGFKEFINKEEQPQEVPTLNLIKLKNLSEKIKEEYDVETKMLNKILGINGEVSNAYYDLDKNQIYITSNTTENELLSAALESFLLNNTDVEVTDLLYDMFTEISDRESFKYNNEIDFIQGLFTNPKLKEKLSKLDAKSEKYNNLLDEFISVISKKFFSEVTPEIMSRNITTRVQDSSTEETIPDIFSIRVINRIEPC